MIPVLGRRTRRGIVVLVRRHIPARDGSPHERAVCEPREAERRVSTQASSEWHGNPCDSQCINAGRGW
jgi:hypothetical protein